MKLNLAIIGQGRSGRDIHGLYYISEAKMLRNYIKIRERQVIKWHLYP